MNKTSDTSEYLILGIITGMLAISIFFGASALENINAHNKYQCAVYGFEVDCKTPLAESERLK